MRNPPRLLNALLAAMQLDLLARDAEGHAVRMPIAMPLQLGVDGGLCALVFGEAWPLDVLELAGPTMAPIALVDCATDSVVMVL